MVSLPRLELCAAHLAARLVVNARQTLNLQSVTLHMWSDSNVVLGWIQGHPSRWKTYVANRVPDIQRRVPEARWRHVSVKENPADWASRGLLPRELSSYNLWWRGPEWLNHRDSWTTARSFIRDVSEESALRLHMHALPEKPGNNLVLSMAEKIEETRSPYLTAGEIQDARDQWVRIEQERAFSKELGILRSGWSVIRKSHLARLHPILDATGILRVGGRLQHSTLSNNQRHPRILPADSPLARLLAEEAHARCLQGGTQLTLATLRKNYWVLRGRQVVKGTILKCNECIKWMGHSPVQLMGDLPASRVVPSRAFLKIGVDYAGPYPLRTEGGRGHRTRKGYICLFVCLTTRAVHLEAVPDGSTETFIAALTRFVARRGLCAEIRSDCGTASVGADRELKALVRPRSTDDTATLAAIEDKGIRWTFNPPGAPHFGGIWEAAVKSTEHHLRRVLGETKLNYEEMATLLSSIEACLNSRPLHALGDEPGDLAVLTPDIS